MKNKTMIDKLIPYLKRGYRSSFEMQQYLKSSSGDRAFRSLRSQSEITILRGCLKVAIYTNGWHRLSQKEYHKPDGHRYLRWKLVKV